MAAEAIARADADTTLQGNIDAEATTRSDKDVSLQSQIDGIVEPEDWNIYVKAGNQITIGPGETKFNRAYCNDFNDIVLSGGNFRGGATVAIGQTFDVQSFTAQPSCTFDEFSQEWVCAEGSYFHSSTNNHDSLSSTQNVVVTCLEVLGTGDPEE